MQCNLSTLVRFKTTETSNNYVCKSKILYTKAYYIGLIDIFPIFTDKKLKVNFDFFTRY